MEKKQKLIIIGAALAVVAVYFALVYKSPARKEKEAENIFNKSVAFQKANNLYNAVIGYNMILKKYSGTKYADGAYRSLIGINNDVYFNRDEAIRLSKKYYDKFPKTDFTPQALYIIAHNYLYFKGDREAAKKYLKILQEKYPESPVQAKVMTAVSNINIAEGNYTELIKVNNDLIKSHPKEVVTDNLILANIEAYYKLGQMEAGYKEAQKIKNPNAPNIADSLPYHFVLLAKRPSSELYMKISKIYGRMGLRQQADFYAAKASGRTIAPPKTPQNAISPAPANKTVPAKTVKKKK